MSLYCSPPKFFKIIQNHELQNGELRVPKKFVENYWEGIPNPVVIRLPNGVQQDLCWVKRDGDIWFRKNWEKIAKFLKFGFVVNFSYMGGSCFQLDIFGLNCVEIDYSNIKFKKEAPQFIEVSDEDDSDESEMQKQFQRRQNGKRKMNMDLDCDFEVSNESDDDDADDNDESEIHKQFQRTQNAKRKFNMDFDFDFDTAQANISSMNKKAKKDIKAETNVASTSQRRKSGRRCVTNNSNPGFELKLSQTYAQGYLFRIPADFSRIYMKRFDGVASLRVLGMNRIWNLNVKYDCNTKYSVVNGGWHSFTKENNLQIGDICKFDMIHARPFTFIVTIIRAREKPRTRHLRGYEKGNSKGPNTIKEELSRHGKECYGKFAASKVGRKVLPENWYRQP